MTKVEFEQIILMLEKFKKDMVNRIDKHNREFEAMFFIEEDKLFDCVECEKQHEENISCLEAMAIKHNV